MCLPDIFSLITKSQDVVYDIYLLTFLQTLEFVRFTYKLFVSSALKSFAFFSLFLFFHSNFSNNFTPVLCFPLSWWFVFLFFNLERSRRWRWLWLIRSCHFASFHDLWLYRNFANKMCIFFLIFVASISNIKCHLTFQTIIIYTKKYFRKSIG